MGPFLSEIFKQAGKKVVEEVVLGIAAGAIIKGVKDHGPTVLKAAKDNAPAAFDAAKDKASDAVDAARVVGKAATRKFRK
jgi:hypothetical protein